MVSQKVKAQAQFLTWLNETHPTLYDTVVGKVMVNETGNQLGQVEPPAPETESMWDKVTTGLMAVGTSVLAYKSQRDLLKLNIARAEQGLPPLEAGATAPVIRTEIALDPEVIDKLTREAGMGINKILLLGGAALALFFVLK